MPVIAYNIAKMKQNGVLRFIIKSQKCYNMFWGTNERVVRDLGAQWKNLPMASTDHNLGTDRRQVIVAFNWRLLSHL